MVSDATSHSNGPVPILDPMAVCQQHPTWVKGDSDDDDDDDHDDDDDVVDDEEDPIFFMANISAHSTLQGPFEKVCRQSVHAAGTLLGFVSPVQSSQSRQVGMAWVDRGVGSGGYGIPIW